MKVLETLLVVRLVMRHKKMSLVQLVDILFGTSSLMSVVVTENNLITHYVVTVFFDVRWVGGASVQAEALWK
jgi:hypothetical protein